MADKTEQSQVQNQSVNIAVSLDSSSDPDLERHIFAKVSSVGRQLGRISDVLDVLLNACEQAKPAVGNEQNPAADEAIKAFRQMREQIEDEKQRRNQKRIKTALQELAASVSALDQVDLNALNQLLA